MFRTNVANLHLEERTQPKRRSGQNNRRFEMSPLRTSYKQEVLSGLEELSDDKIQDTNPVIVLQLILSNKIC